jgi:serine/threonine-protein kinase HipA
MAKKNHSFIFDKLNDCRNLSPAYDVTYSLNPLVNYKKTSRVLSVNNKRTNISLEDVKYIAQKYTVRNYASTFSGKLIGCHISISTIE